LQEGKGELLKMKKALIVLLLIFVAVAGGFIIRDAVREKVKPAQAGQMSAGSQPAQIPTNSGAGKTCDPNKDKSCSQTNNPGPELGQPAKPDTSNPAKPDAGNPSRKVIAYYFHGNVRCSTCRTLEAYSEEAIQSGFPEALKQEILEWKVVNVEEPDNRHFIKDYQLYTKSLVIVKMEGDKQVEWKNLDRIWELVRDKPAFLQYVQTEISGYLGK
jgi:hypothetical protein